MMQKYFCLNKNNNISNISNNIVNNIALYIIDNTHHIETYYTTMTNGNQCYNIEIFLNYYLHCV